jgi:hypothetical protein
MHFPSKKSRCSPFMFNTDVISHGEEFSITGKLDCTISFLRVDAERRLPREARGDSRATTPPKNNLRDMGTHGSPPTRVLEVPVKWTQPARSPADLQVDPEILFTIPVTLEDLRRPHPDFGRPAGLVAQVSPLDRGAPPPVGPRIAGSFL